MKTPSSKLEFLFVFKFVFLFVFVFQLSMVTLGQTYERSRGNIGFVGSYLSTKTTSTGGYFEGPHGNTFEAGITRGFNNLIYPAILYRRFTGQYFPTSRQVATVPMQENYYMDAHSIAVPINLRWQFWGLYMGKSKSYECKGLDIALLAGVEYAFNLSHRSETEMIGKNAFSYLYGLSFRPTRSGGAKSAQKRSLWIDVFYQAGSRNFTHSNEIEGETNWTHRYFGVRLNLLLYKVYKFSNM